jgi:hypothetical protein
MRNIAAPLLGLAIFVALAAFALSSMTDIGADVMLAVIAAVTPPATP